MAPCLVEFTFVENDFARTKDGGTDVVIIRPCSGIFGYADRLVTEHYIRTGVIDALVQDAVLDMVYVENVCLAMLLAELKLRIDPAHVRGQVINVSNNEPMSGLDFYRALHAVCPTGTSLRILPRGAMRMLAHVIQGLQWLRYRVGLDTCRWAQLGPMERLTPATMELTELSYVFDSAKAKQLLDYTPIYSVGDGLAKTVELTLRDRGGTYPVDRLE